MMNVLGFGKHEGKGGLVIQGTDIGSFGANVMQALFDSVIEVHVKSLTMVPSAAGIPLLALPAHMDTEHLPCI